MPTAELPTPTPLPGRVRALPARIEDEAWGRTLWQLGRFGLVGCVNTLVDLLTLNCLLWLWPTRNTGLLLLANSLAYALGALNSFLLNRAWTFQRRERVYGGEVARFARGNVISAAQSRNAGFFSFSRNSQPALSTWIIHHCATVPASQWQSSSSNTTLLYDCADSK